MLYNILGLGVLIFFLVFFIFLFLFQLKISKLESKIQRNFESKNNLIPALFEVTQTHLVKHDEIFHEILLLKKINFSEQNFYINIQNTLRTQQCIHKEMDFIFRVCQKHQKLSKNYKFSYIQETLFQRIDEIGILINLYNIMVEKYNFYLKIKNIILVGLFVPMHKRVKI